ncbi:MAG: hypothetical protein IT452_12260 [Planctomycetia bacterium]|nr:hypothetical protein [Planctomycetia bacterium]
MPGDRARLHAHALEAIESLFGGRPPSPGAATMGEYREHPVDALAADLADLASLAAGARDSGALEEAARLYLRRAAERAEHRFQNAAAGEFWKRLSLRVEGAGRVEALRRAAGVRLHAAEFAEARGILGEALAEARRAGVRVLEGRILRELGKLHRLLGNVEESRRLHGEGLDVHRACGERRHETVEDAFRRALDIHRANGIERDEGVDRCGLALLLLASGRVEEARRAWDEGAALARGKASYGDAADLEGEMRAACLRAGIPAFAGLLPSPRGSGPRE